MPIPAPQAPQAPADDIVDIQLSLPRSQLATALDVVSQLAAMLQEAQAQTDAASAPPGGGEAPPEEGVAPAGPNSPGGLMQALQGMSAGGY